jgi:hypothetical protein
MRKYETRMGYRVWAALERYELKRDWASHELRHVLPVETGVVHAFGTRDTANRDPEFFHADGPFAICGQHVKVRLPVSFPSDDEEACPRCVELVAQGKTSHPKSEYRMDCDETVRPEMEGFSQVVTCCLKAAHKGSHRTVEGGTWRDGAEDFTPTDYSA